MEDVKGLYNLLMMRGGLLKYWLDGGSALPPFVIVDVRHPRFLSPYHPFIELKLSITFLLKIPHFGKAHSVNY